MVTQYLYLVVLVNDSWDMGYNNITDLGLCSYVGTFQLS